MATHGDRERSGHRLKLTNLDKVLYPETGTTKAEVLDYYCAASPTCCIPHAANRPATRKRWVNGVGSGPGCSSRRTSTRGTPSWVKRRDIQHSDHVNEYPLVNDLATLTWLGQIAALEIHVPQWRFGRTGVQEPRPPRAGGSARPLLGHARPLRRRGGLGRTRP